MFFFPTGVEFWTFMVLSCFLSCGYWKHIWSLVLMCQPQQTCLKRGKDRIQPVGRHYELSCRVLIVLLLTQGNAQYGEMRGEMCVFHKISLSFGLDYNNKMSESLHSTLIRSNCLQENQSHAFFCKMRAKKKTFIFILLASLIFFYFSLTFRK